MVGQVKTTLTNMNKTVSIIVIALVIIIGGYLIFRGGDAILEDSETQSTSLEDAVTSNEDELESPIEISMVSGNLFFTPKNLTLAKDQPVRITFQNTGTHTFTIDELDVNITLRGSSGVAEFTPTQSGTFEYYCAVPGHRGGGMFGSVTVE